MKDYTVNIIGYGYVGGAMGHLCKLNKMRFNVYDTYPKDTTYYFSKLNEMVINAECNENNKLNVYFVCVPTPSKDNGNDDDNHGDCDTSIVMSVINQLNELVTKSSVVILKSTVTPGTCIGINESVTNDNIKFVFCPEFLKETTYLDDIANAEFVLLGSDGNNLDDNIKLQLTTVFNDLYNHKTGDIEVIFEDYTICEMFKYTVNVHLAVKVWYFNEINQICDKFNIDYNKLRNLFRLESRIGESHTQVPGPDGLMGFGGKCLVKESKGMARLQEKLGIPNTILRDILLRNKFLRNNSKSDIVDPYQHSTLIPTVNDIVEKVKDLNV
jgi:UDPglucose 6-dehydrogenase